jgi:CubicO group peptidase (beta-lactamase class C family)
VPTSTAVSPLAGLTFTNPQDDPAWTHVVVPAVSSGPAGELPSAYRDLHVDVVGAGRSRGLEAWVTETTSTSLLVLDGQLDGGTVVHEWYADGLDAGTLFLGASATKSVLAHLVGRAVRDGALELTESVTAHVPELAGTGYDGTTVLDALTMTTGVD